MDHDIDVANNYAANDGKLIGHDNLKAGAHARPGRSDRLLPVHDLGVSVALVPVDAAAAPLAQRVSESLLARFRMTPGLFLYSLISLTLLAACSIACGFLTRSLASVTTPRRAALLGLLVGLPPVLSHSFLIFPEAFGFVVAWPSSVGRWKKTRVCREPGSWRRLWACCRGFTASTRFWCSPAPP